MELDKVLSLCGMLFAFLATLMLSRIILLNPGQALGTTYHESPIGWPSTAILEDFVTKKFDGLFSVYLFTLAIILQLVASCMEGHALSINFEGVILVVDLFFLVIYSTYLLAARRAIDFSISLRKLAAKNFLISCFETKSCPLYRDVKAIANQYFNIVMRDGEGDAEFVRRFAKYLKCNLASDVSFSRFR